VIGLRLRRFAAGYRGFTRNVRVFIASSFLSSAAFGLFFVNFNLYLVARGFDAAMIGLVATTTGLTLAAAAVPASILANRLGRRLTMLCGAAAVMVALLGFIVLDATAAIFGLAVVYGVGQQLLQIPASPFLTENSNSEQRNEVFALNAATFNLAQVLVGLMAGTLVGLLGLGIGGVQSQVATFHVLLVAMLALIAAATVMLARLREDLSTTARARLTMPSPEGLAPEYAAPRLRARLSRIGVHIGEVDVFLKIVTPGFLISIGAGQVLPFLNLYIVGRFGLDVSETNVVFAVSALGTMIAILIQPVLARRYGKIASVVMVQAASIPFITVLGFAPWIWLVIAGMTVRNALMNAANPIFGAFVMERVRPHERATLAASMSISWSVGWAIGGTFYATVQSTLGFEQGYNLNFATIIVLYSISTALYWLWFGRAERAERTGATLEPTSTSGAAGRPVNPAP
jgi:Major Facilitator Superfamily.